MNEMKQNLDGRKFRRKGIKMATWTHKEMACSVGLISKLMANPGQAHMDLLLHTAYGISFP
jgi:hypothetical protein